MKEKQYDCFSLINKTHILHSNFDGQDARDFLNLKLRQKNEKMKFLFLTIFIKGDSDYTCFNIK